MSWLDCGNYWLSTAPQKSEEWLAARVGRVTAASMSSCIGESTYGNKDPDKMALYISGKEKEEFSPEALMRMEHGVEYEDVAREWYCKKYNCQVEEYGLAVPKWELYIGASTDGVVLNTNGCIEIKCPKRMYAPLRFYIDAITCGMMTRPNVFPHITKSHYFQMQQNMAVLEKEWCDYIVYSTEDQEVFCQRVPFNREEWEKKTLPRIRGFVNDKLKPLLADGSPIMPS